MPKFFAPDSNLREEYVILSGGNAEHLRVLRVRPGEEITVSDGQGMEARCVVDTAGKDGCRLRVLERIPSTGEPTIRVTVYAA